MSTLNVKVHPVVLFNIVDAYERRNLDQRRVIGTLLGSTDKSGAVEVTNCFVVKHLETEEEVAIDIELAQELYELYRKVNGNETIVGWFATGDEDVNEYSVLIHEYYTRQTPNPVHLVITPSKAGVGIKAFVSTPFGIPDKTGEGNLHKGTMFAPIPCLTKAAGYDTELVGLKACMQSFGIGAKGYPESEVEMLLAAAHQCSENISAIIKFIDNCILNSTAPTASLTVSTNEIGRQLMSMIEGLAPFGEDDEQLNTNLKDLLMVVYLSNLTKTQLMLNEKLSLL